MGMHEPQFGLVLDIMLSWHQFGWLFGIGIDRLTIHLPLLPRSSGLCVYLLPLADARDEQVRFQMLQRT
jgi:hypothetical protein